MLNKAKYSLIAISYFFLKN